jgi:dolichyl-phosphate beta-glucosyltransferase
VLQDVYLSVIVPAYNEAERLPKTLKRFDEYLTATGFAYEILVMLDGPSDNTREVLREMLREIPHLKVIDRPVNRGKGFTVKEGMLRAAGRIRLFTDADNSTDIAHFEKMKPFFNEGYDLVIASRNSKDAPNAEEAVPQAWYKRWTGRVGNLIVQLLAVPGIWDTQCGFKAFRAEVAERIFSDTKIEDGDLISRCWPWLAPSITRSASFQLTGSMTQEVMFDGSTTYGFLEYPQSPS